MLEGYKEIAKHVRAVTGRNASEVTMRKLRSRERNPLPVRRLLGRVLISTDELEAWIANEWIR